MSSLYKAMRKISKKSIVLSVVIAVFVASFLCCCLPGVSHANSSNIKSESAESHCHSDAPKTANSEDSKSCECEQTAAIIDAKGFDSSKIDLSLAKFNDLLFLQSYSFNEIAKESTILTEHSPPIAYKRTIPLYLENSVFRL